MCQFFHFSIPVSTDYVKNLASNIYNWMNKHLYLLFFFNQRCIKESPVKVWTSFNCLQVFFHNLTQPIMDKVTI